MNKEQTIDFIIESITEHYYELGDNSGMTKEQVDEIVDKSNSTIVNFAISLYSKMKEKNLIV
jgi:hypothetical protein